MSQSFSVQNSINQGGVVSFFICGLPGCFVAKASEVGFLLFYWG